MPLMPYALDKGPYFSIVEDFVNGDRGRAVLALERLRAGHPIADLGPLDGAIGGPMKNGELKAHVNEDWFGMRPAPAGWIPQADFDKATKTSTGFWEHWYGDAEGIFRETVRRALEVSLGIGHEEPVTARRTRGGRHWRIALFWNCPHPWYEGWVTWQRWDRTPHGGHVTVVINTPAHRPAPPEGAESRSKDRDTGELWNSPVKPAVDPKADAPYEVDPAEAKGDNGMWVVGQVLNQEWVPDASAAKTSPPGSWRPPVLGNPIHSVGEVVTVAIAERDGGVLPGGRPYVPQP